MAAPDLFKTFKKERKTRLIAARQAIRAAECIRYKILFQWRNPKGCIGDPQDWRSWRCFGSLPILFYTSDEAWRYMEAVHIFKNMQHLRKVSCSVERVLLKPTTESSNGKVQA